MLSNVCLYARIALTPNPKHLLQSTDVHRIKQYMYINLNIKNTEDSDQIEQQFNDKCVCTPRSNK